MLHTYVHTQFLIIQRFYYVLFVFINFICSLSLQLFVIVQQRSLLGLTRFPFTQFGNIIKNSQ